MKHITRVLLCAAGLAAWLATSCTIDPPSRLVSQPDLIKLPSFQAMVVRVETGNVVAGGNLVGGNWVAANLVSTNGGRMVIGGPQASAEMIAFVRSLHKRQVCTLPDDFITFQKAQAGNKQ